MIGVISCPGRGGLLVSYSCRSSCSWSMLEIFFYELSEHTHTRTHTHDTICTLIIIYIYTCRDSTYIYFGVGSTSTPGSTAVYDRSATYERSLSSEILFFLQCMFVRIRCPPSWAHIAGKTKKNSRPYCIYFYIISRPTALKFSSRLGPGPYRLCTVYVVRCTLYSSER